MKLSNFIKGDDDVFGLLKDEHNGLGEEPEGGVAQWRVPIVEFGWAWTDELAYGLGDQKWD